MAYKTVVYMLNHTDDTAWDFINQSWADFLINMCLTLIVSIHESTKQQLKIHQVPINDTKVAVQYAIIW